MSKVERKISDMSDDEIIEAYSDYKANNIDNGYSVRPFDEFLTTWVQNGDIDLYRCLKLMRHE